MYHKILLPKQLEISADPQFRRDNAGITLFLIGVFKNSLKLKVMQKRISI